MNIQDIRALAGCIYRNSPGGHEPPGRIEAWVSFVEELADEIGRRNRGWQPDASRDDYMVTDHRFNAEVFAGACEGRGSYSLSDPEENTESWENEVLDPIFTSPVVLGSDV
jgi:hypothetical protein